MSKYSYEEKVAVIKAHKEGKGNRIISREHGIPLNLEKVVEVNASVRTLDEICESLDYTRLYKAYKRKSAKGKADPVSLFKVLVY